ncbi:MAG: glycosyltransferase family 2 protein [Acidobacteriota bacterium]
MSRGVSVLIVAHGGREVLAATLRGLEAERDDLLEVIVADNGSPDDTVAMVQQDFSWIRVLELGENLGFGAANNRAAAIARGDLLLLLNSDARPHPGTIGQLVSALRADAGAAVACPRLDYADGSPQFHWAPTTSVVGEALQLLRNRVEHLGWVHRPIGGRGWFTAACLMARRAAFEQIEGFDEGFFLYFEDVDLCLRLRAAGWRLLDVPSARAVHLKGGSQRPNGDGAPLSPAGELEYRRSQLRYYAVHRPRWEQRLLRWKLRRKFERVDDADRRRQLLALLDARTPAGRRC